MVKKTQSRPGFCCATLPSNPGGVLLFPDALESHVGLETKRCLGVPFTVGPGGVPLGPATAEAAGTASETAWGPIDLAHRPSRLTSHSLILYITYASLIVLVLAAQLCCFYLLAVCSFTSCPSSVEQKRFLLARRHLLRRSRSSDTTVR
jgi:hypothetical protein